MKLSEIKERIKGAYIIGDEVLDNYNDKIITKIQMEVRMKMLWEVIDKLDKKIPDENV